MEPLRVCKLHVCATARFFSSFLWGYPWTSNTLVNISGRWSAWEGEGESSTVLGIYGGACMCKYVCTILRTST